MAVHVETEEADKNIPALRRLTSRPSPVEIVNMVKTMFAENEKLFRQASIHICHKYSGVKLLRETGNLFDVGETAIVEASRRFLLKMVERVKRDLKI